MGRVNGRTLHRAGYIREFFFEDTKSLSAYLKTLRGKWYILDQTVFAGCLLVTIVQQYNDTPIWEP